VSLTTCCVCHQPVDADAPRLGGRAYCAEHYARVSRDRKGLWLAGAAQIVGLAVFVLAAGALFALPQFESLSGPALVLIGAGLALVPALFWLAFFYQQDRLEPEPKGRIALVFAGGLLAAALGERVIHDLFRVQDWLNDSPTTAILGGILIVGFTQEFLKYAVVRYTVYPTAEFDERVDGLIYGTAAGLGYATWLNVDYVLGYGGVALSAGVVAVAVTALAQASFSGIMGYFLGRAKFEGDDLLVLPLGLALAAACNGLFAYGRAQVVATALGPDGRLLNPLYALGLAAVFSAVVLGVLLALVRRANRLTIEREGRA
jgi:RsiW-degrading membrane proteinase PrsW (M82 family)